MAVNIELPRHTEESTVPVPVIGAHRSSPWLIPMTVGCFAIKKEMWWSSVDLERPCRDVLSEQWVEGCRQLLLSFVLTVLCA